MSGRLPVLASARAVTVAIALSAGCGSGDEPSSQRPDELAPTHGRYAPPIDRANFVRRIDNRYLPFEPGQRLVHGRELVRASARPLREGERLLEVGC